ncbi:MAG: helix-turn-helix transcriptional regulator [Bacteroidota bacterium]
MLERILELLKERKLTPSQFADEIGIQRSGMSHLISGRNKPSLEFVMKVLHRFPEVKADWLINGITERKSEEAPPESEDEDMIASKVPATLFDDPDLSGTRPQVKQQRIVRKERSDRRIEKIVVFYDDRTFREYEPEK